MVGLVWSSSTHSLSSRFSWFLVMVLWWMMLGYLLLPLPVNHSLTWNFKGVHIVISSVGSPSESKDHGRNVHTKWGGDGGWPIILLHWNGLRNMDGLKFFNPAWWKHKWWKERNAQSHHKYCQQNNQHFFQSASKISNIVLYNWCYSDGDFTWLPHLLCSFRTTQQLHDWNNESTA